MLQLCLIVYNKSSILNFLKDIDLARTASVAENEEDRARRKNEERKKRREKRERSKNRKDALAPGPEIQTEIQNIQEGLPPEPPIDISELSPKSVLNSSPSEKETVKEQPIPDKGHIEPEITVESQDPEIIREPEIPAPTVTTMLTEDKPEELQQPIDDSEPPPPPLDILENDAAAENEDIIEESEKTVIFLIEKLY